MSKQCARAIRDKNQATNLQQPNLEVGDLVIVRLQYKAGQKLRFKWCDPRRIIRTVSQLVLVVERLGSSAKELVHCSCLIDYSATMDVSDVPDDILQLADRTEAKYEVLEAILDISENHEGLWFRLRWDVLPDER